MAGRGHFRVGINGLDDLAFVKGHLGFGAQISASAPMGGDFELTRQDGRDMALIRVGRKSILDHLYGAHLPGLFG